MTQPDPVGSSEPLRGRESARQTAVGSSEPLRGRESAAPLKPKAIIIAGPTASGKSALALELAERFGGTVINADAMQCYRELRVVTARPPPEDEARAPHALYGVLPVAEAGSVAWWREAALAEMAKARLPILCGGTGMYLRALTQGLSVLPEVPPAAREEARARLAALGSERLHAELHPEDAAKLRPSDGQRIARALEILLSTGQSLAAWHRAAPRLPPADFDFRAILLTPPREQLHPAIIARWGIMRGQGAASEVGALVDQGLDPSLPAMRAHGVPELAAEWRGEISREEADRRAIAGTWTYTRRQATWFRHQELVPPAATHRINARIAGLTQFSERNAPEIFAFLQSGG